MLFRSHACFTLTNDNHTIIFDPYLEGSSYVVDDFQVEYIFVSHAHFDHIGSAFELAKKCDATIISTAEICHMATEAGLKAHAMHIGGTHMFPFGKVRITLAFHGSGVPGGHACGFIVDFYGTKLYFAGDTGIFKDMELLQTLDHFEYAVLPIGDNFTMGPYDALLAAEFLRAKYIIPVHYNTWTLIAQDPYKYKTAVEGTTSTEVLVIEPGDSVEL